ncbi:unnamed protein product [Ranitomeya imitator]|uniref:Uncharacterized protein n=1 Tax=Ranitomeya imitator TaxID=111125 RepID=A0ABN9KWA3_9NEOB|nr:unnamed protein product [Ranitomeya imitator]
MYNILEHAVPSGIIDKKTQEFLTKIDPITPVFYTLPNIHKTLDKPPGKPIVALTDSVLSPFCHLYQYTGAFLSTIKEVGKISKETLLVTLDVNKQSSIEPTVIIFLIEPLKLVLTENYFLFKDTYYLQIQGTAMGSKVAPPYANAYISYFESEFI